MAPEFKLFNTLSGKIEHFEPMDTVAAKAENRSIKVKMYVCGPTVYDDAHLGHARCYITWDVLYRFLKFMGYNVTYVRNVTDVDDKILNRANERGETPAALAERNYLSFQEDMAQLNILSPDIEPRATAYIQEMQAGIQALIAKNAAYTTSDGSVYFRVAAKADYGQLKYTSQDPTVLKKHLDDLKAGARVDVDEEKESPLDFALWKAVPTTDPHGWESPWPAQNQEHSSSKGWGRPGWHMECSAMNHAVFGEQIDIHAGGADLIFPHHENEIAQSEAWTGKQPFAKYWLHNGFVNVSGEKMSKSLGNFSTIKTLLKRYDANTIRHFLLTNGYRMPVDFNDEALQSSENWVKTRHKWLKQAIQTLNYDLQTVERLILPTMTALEATSKHEQEAEASADFFSFIQGMANDLNTSDALAKLNAGLARLKTEDVSPKHTDALQMTLSMWTLLGFSITPLFAEQQDVVLPHAELEALYQTITGTPYQKNNSPSTDAKPLLEDLLGQRKQAKQNKDWAKADAIRQQLTSLGLQLLDHKDGTSTVEKDGVEVVRG